MVDPISGSRAVVTGAASGIGRALVDALLEAGAHGIALDVDQKLLGQLSATSKSAADRLHVFRADVSDPSAMELAKAFSDSVMNGVDLLFNNAGVAFNSKPLWETTDEMVDWNYGVNVFGVINGIRAFVPAMIKQRRGYIVNTASIGGFQVSNRIDLWHQGLYASTKFAVVALTESLALELAQYGIGASVLAPSGVATGIAKSDRNRPDRFGGPGTGSSTAAMAAMIETDSDPALVARMTLDAVRKRRLYIFTDTDLRERLRERAQHIDQGIEETIAFLTNAQSAAT
jgi:NAD(P)-dependent dehydrogenase (short-subunit alcohol dehydrogenase family)